MPAAHATLRLLRCCVMGAYALLRLCGPWRKTLSRCVPLVSFGGLTKTCARLSISGLRWATQRGRAAYSFFAGCRYPRYAHAACGFNAASLPPACSRLLPVRCLPCAVPADSPSVLILVLYTCGCVCGAAGRVGAAAAAVCLMPKDGDATAHILPSLSQRMPLLPVLTTLTSSGAWRLVGRRRGCALTGRRVSRKGVIAQFCLPYRTATCYLPAYLSSGQLNLHPLCCCCLPLPIISWMTSFSGSGLACINLQRLRMTEGNGKRVTATPFSSAF